MRALLVETPQTCGFAALCALGMATAWMTRLAQEGEHERRWQRLFFVALSAVAGAGCWTWQLGPAHVLTTGTTVAVMSLAATSTRRAAISA